MEICKGREMRVLREESDIKEDRQIGKEKETEMEVEM